MALLNLLERICIVVPAQMHKSASSRPDFAETRRWKATYEVTGISPQSMTFAQELNGFAASGTL